MSLETVTTISTLDPSNPTHDDSIGEADAHLRNIKGALKTTFPAITTPITLTSAVLNGLPAAVSQAVIAAVAAAATNANQAIGVALAAEASSRAAADNVESQGRIAAVAGLQAGAAAEANSRYYTDQDLYAQVRNEAATRLAQDNALSAAVNTKAPYGSYGDNNNGTYFWDIHLNNANIRKAVGNVGLGSANGQAWSFGVAFAVVLSVQVTCTSPGHHVEVQVRDNNSGFAWAYDNAGNIAPGVGFYFEVTGLV